MLQRTVTLSAAAVAMSSLAACGGSSAVSVTGASTSSTLASSSAVSSTSKEATPPSASLPAYLQHVAIGDCVDRSSDKLVVGDCSKSHRYEVSAVVASEWDKHDMLARNALRNWTCDKAGPAYLGGPIMATFFNTTPLPAAEDPRSDDRIICLTNQFGDHDGRSVLTFGRMRGQLSDQATRKRRRTCLVQATTVADAGDPVRCSAKHSAEAVTNVWLGKLTASYPGDAKTGSKLRKACAPKVRDFLGGVHRPDLVVGATGPNVTDWEAGRRFGTCFVNIKGAKLTQSVQNIKNKPLKDFR